MYAELAQWIQTLALLDKAYDFEVGYKLGNYISYVFSTNDSSTNNLDKPSIEYEVSLQTYQLIKDGRDLGDLRYCEVSFKNITHYSFDITGDGNATKVFATVLKIIRHHLEQNHKIAILSFSGNSASRVKLYESFVANVHKYLPGWQPLMEEITTNLSGTKKIGYDVQLYNPNRLGRYKNLFKPTPKTTV